MSLSILTKPELAALFLAEIRKHHDCAGVDDVVIVETTNPRSAFNWEVCLIAASSGDPSDVQRAVKEVQQRFQPLYRVS
jgi:hypothetical protein